MSLKRSADHFDLTSSSPPSKRSRTGIRLDPGKLHEPQKQYTKHPDSGVGKNFHSVSYPLALLPYSSWYVLHHGKGGVKEHQCTCSKCGKTRAKVAPHERKLFLVAERLSWHSYKGLVPSSAKALNEEQLWAVNFDLGISDPAVEDPVQEPGGRRSKENPFYPYGTEEEMEAALSLLQHSSRLSEHSFKIWLSVADNMSAEKDKRINLRLASVKQRIALSSVSSSESNSLVPRPLVEIGQAIALKPPALPPVPPVKNTEHESSGTIEPAIKISEKRGHVQEINESANIVLLPPEVSTHPSKVPQSAWPYELYMQHPTTEKIVAKFEAFLNKVPPQAVHRVAEQAASSRAIELLLAQMGNGIANANDMKKLDNLVNECYHSWKTDQALLEFELGMPRNRKIHGLDSFAYGRQKYRVMPAIQRGGVHSGLIHYILERGRNNMFFGRFLDQISSGHSTPKQQHVFIDVLNEFEKFFFSNDEPAFHQNMQLLEASIMDALVYDPAYRPRKVPTFPEWTQRTADVAATRLSYVKVCHLGPLAEKYGENGLVWVDPLNILDLRDRMDAIRSLVPPRDFTQMYAFSKSDASVNSTMSLIGRSGQHTTPPPLLAAPVERSKTSREFQTESLEERVMTPFHFLIPPQVRPGGTIQSSQLSLLPSMSLETQIKEPINSAVRYRTLAAFYSLLDEIERTSYVGARYLEMYAEYLKKECCNDCWMKSMGVDIKDEKGQDDQDEEDDEEESHIPEGE